MIQNGNLIRLLLNNTLVAKLVALDVNYEREMLDKTVKDSAAWKEFQAGNKSFSLSCEGLVVDPYDKNMVRFSENFQDDFWQKSSLTISDKLYAAPDGFIKANRTSGGTTGDSITAEIFDLEFAAATEYTFSVWLRSTSGSVNMVLELSDDSGSNAEAITATTTWQRFSTSYTMATGDLVQASLQWAANGNLDIFGAQVELGSTATDYEPTGLIYADLHSAVQNGTEFTAQVTDQTNGNIEYIGSVYLNSISRTAPQGQLQTYSVELTGTGAFNDSTI